jgi:hypothetical protein
MVEDRIGLAPLVSRGCVVYVPVDRMGLDDDATARACTCEECVVAAALGLALTYDEVGSENIDVDSAKSLL